ncbi:MAG: SulP family inorganic anion transporter [Campylobacterales bacterium]|nr:SulP family inorganic anion transporter [Campylobacterales bacterium]
MKTTFRGDLFGGVTAAIIALPLALAFGVASGLGASAGLWGAIILGFLASLFGGTPTQISGPTGPMTVVVASSVVVLHGNIGLIVSMIALAGIFQIVFGMIKAGKFVQYIPYPVISGFMSGIGIIIIILQLKPLFGFNVDSSVPHTLITLFPELGSMNVSALLLGVLALAIVYLIPQKISRYIPSPLLALVILTIVSLIFNLDVQRIGDIPSGFPSLVMPGFDLKLYSTIISLAFTLAILGSIDTLLTSIVADSITRTKHNPNKELIAQGLGNLVCGITGSVPGAGATMRTVINVKSGGTTRYSGIIHSLTLLGIVLLLAPLASKIPLALLAGLLIKVGIDILDYKFIKVWRQSPRNDLLVMLSVFFITVFFDLMIAVGVGVLLACLLVVYRITKETDISLEDSKDYKDRVVPEGTRIITIEGAFFFGSSTFFESKINTILDTQKIIIDISSVPFVDLTAIFTLKEFISRLKDDGVEISIVAKSKHTAKLMKFNHDKIFDDVKFFEKCTQALA